MLRLRNLVLEGFRCFRSRVELDLSYDLVILVGPVGTGKTSILSAIQYALYGTVYEVREHTAKLEDLVNDYVPELYVKLTLADESTQYVVERRRRRRGRPTAYLYTGTTTVSGEKEVTENITKLLGISVEDFLRHVYVSHRVLELMIYGTPAQRSLAMDRVLGLDEIENLFRQLPLSLVEKRISELKEKVRDFEKLRQLLERYRSRSEVEERIQHLERELQDLRREREILQQELEKLRKLVEEYRVKDEQYRKLTSEYEFWKLKAQSIAEEMEKLTTELGEVPRLVEVAAELSALRDYLVVKLEELLMTEESEKLSSLEIREDNIVDVLTTLLDTVKRLEEKRYELTEDLLSLSRELATQRAELERIRMEYSTVQRQLSAMSEMRREYEELVRRYGTASEVEEKIRKLESEISSTSTEVQYLESLLSILTRVLQELRSGRSVTCPVCGREVRPEEKEHIETHLRKCSEKLSEYRYRVPEVQRRVEELRLVLPKLRSMEEVLSKYVELESRASVLRKKLEECREKVSALESMRDELRKKIDLLGDFTKRTRRKLETFEKILTYLRLRREYEEVERRLSDLRKRIQELDYSPKLLEQTSSRMLQLSTRLSEVTRRVQELEREVQELREVEKYLSPETEKLVKMVTALEELKQRLTKVKSLYRTVQAKVRSKLVSRVRSLVVEFFREIYRFSDIIDVELEVEEIPSEEYVRSVYTFYGVRPDKTKVPLLSKLSEGQKILLVFSFVTAVHQLLRGNVGFALLDDPVPNVDPDTKLQVVRFLVNLVAEGGTQLILTTQDMRIVEELRRVAQEKRISYVVYSLGKEDLEPRIQVLEKWVPST